MSTTLSMISRQLALSMTSVSHVQSVHWSSYACSTRGITTSSGGGLPSGSFQTKSCLFCSRVSQVRVRARSGIRLA